MRTGTTIVALLIGSLYANVCGSAETLPAESLRLVPFPKEVHLADGGLKLDARRLVIRVSDTMPGRQAAVDLEQELSRLFKGQFGLAAFAPPNDQPLLLWVGKKNSSIRKLQQALGPLPEQEEGYALVVTGSFAAVGARHPAGLAHGIQTLRQLVRANLREGRLPAVTIRDWPSLRYRGFSDDITRGPSPTLTTLQREVELSALLRMNFFVCPGVSCWGRVLPDFQVSVTNIANFVRDGVKQHALGMINTTWDDSGCNLAGWNWYGVAWGAECAWNASTTPVAAFNERVGAVLFGEQGKEFGEAVEILGRAHRLRAFKQMPDSAFFEPDFKVWLADPKAVGDAESLRQLTRSALEKLDAAGRSAAVDGEILGQFRFGARLMDLMASRVIEGQMAADAYRRAMATDQPSHALNLLQSGCTARVTKLRGEYVALKDKYQELWNAENRPYALSRVTARYDRCIAYCDEFLQRLASAEADLKNGRLLPAPAAIGFQR